MKRTFGSTSGTIEINGKEREIEVLYTTEFRKATRTSPAESCLTVDDAKWIDEDVEYCLDDALMDRHYDRLFRMAEEDARQQPFAPNPH